MAWTSPPATVYAGTLIDDDWLNTYVRDNLSASGVAQIGASDGLIYGTGSKAVAALADGTGDYWLEHDGAGSLSWAAGTAAGATVWTGTTTLTDDSISANDATKQWGTEEATITDPGESVAVYAVVTGYGTFNDPGYGGGGGLQYAFLQMQISTDGGGSWSSGTGVRVTIDGGAVCASHYVAPGVPTGDIQARARIGMEVDPGWTYQQYFKAGRITLLAFSEA